MSQQTTLEYATPRATRRWRVGMADVWLTVATAVLTGLSVAVFMEGANTEPYFGRIRPIDGYIQVGIGCVLVFAWIQLTLVLLWLALREQIARFWLMILLWSVICCVYLLFGITGYMNDLVSYQQQTSAPAPVPGGPAGPGVGIIP